MRLRTMSPVLIVKNRRAAARHTSAAGDPVGDVSYGAGRSREVEQWLGGRYRWRSRCRDLGGYGFSSSRPGFPVCSQHLRHGRFGPLSLFNDRAQTIAQGYDIV